MWVLSPNSSTSLFAFIEWNEGFSKVYPRKHFHCGKLQEKKILVKHYSRKKSAFFFFLLSLERLSTKAGALGKNTSAGFAQWNGKSTLFYYHFKPLANFSVEEKKKKRMNKIQIFLVYSLGNSLVKAEQ